MKRMTSKLVFLHYLDVGRPDTGYLQNILTWAGRSHARKQDNGRLRSLDHAYFLLLFRVLAVVPQSISVARCLSSIYTKFLGKFN